VKSKLSSTVNPQNRSRARMVLGRFYFTWRRYALWMKNRAAYAKEIQSTPLPFEVFKYQTPMLRRLKDVEIWLQHNKVKNLKIASEQINGVIIQPGQTFSFWKLVGKPTKAKGYVNGMVLYNGSFKPEVGGGLCQLSNLIYWMTLHTPLTVTERWRHNYDVFPDSDRTQPFGSGATVAYNYIDLQITNETNATFQLLVWVRDKSLHGEWRCNLPSELRYEIYETDHCITHEWWGGYVRHNVIRRKVFHSGNILVADEVVTDNHAVMMYEPLLPQ